MVLKPSSYGIAFGGEGQPVEHDYLSCAHCNMHFRVGKDIPADKLGGFCRLCYKPVCPKCEGKECRPFERWLDQVEQKEYTRLQYNKMLGF